MSEMKAIKEADKLVKKILSDRVSETAFLEEELAKDNAAVAAAEAAIAEAVTSSNLEEYQKAKIAHRNALDAKEMHDARMEALKNAPLISARDYRKTVESILAEVTEMDRAARTRLASLSEEMEDCAMNLREAVVTANDVLQRLQHDIYRDADRAKHGETNQPYNECDRKQVDRSKLDTVDWGLTGVRHYQYGQQTGRMVNY